MRFRLDASWLRVGVDGDTVLAGSPSRLFRLSAPGAAVAARLEQGEDVPSSVLTDRLLDAGAIHPALAGRGIGLSELTIVTPQLGGVVTNDGRVTVDDGSVPPLEGATVRLAANRGPAAARNAGRAAVDTELIAFVDADVDVPALGDDLDRSSSQRWWSALVAHFDDPRVGLVAARICGDVGSSLDLGRKPARVRAGTRVSYVPAAMVIVRAAAFDDVGGFDEMMRYGEDVDFVWRLDQAGWRCRYEPASVAHHQPRATFAGRLRQQVGYGSSSAPLALRHPRALAPYRSSSWTAAIWVLAGFGHPIVAVSVAGASSLALAAKLPSVPRGTSARLAITSHLRAGVQLARSVRRAWWPIVFAAALVSRRARLALLAAFVTSPRSTPLDLAFGWGMWRSMWHHRAWRPIIPDIVGLSPGQPR